MRKKFILYVLIPAIILGIVVYIFIDRWVEAGLESAGETMVGARVEIDDFHLSLFPLGAHFARMQVANPDDPWKNIFETRRVSFAMNIGQLLRGKYIIETMEVKDLIIGTKRTTDGSLPGGKPKTESTSDSRSFSALAEDVLTRSVEKTPIFDPAMLRNGVNIDSLMKVVDLKTLKHIDTLKARAASATAQWQTTLADVDQTKLRLAAMDSSIRTIRVNELKDVQSILSAIQTVDNTRKGINDIVNTYNTRRDAITGEIAQISTAVGAIDDIAKSDYQHVLSLARLPDINAIGIAEALIGKQVVNDVRTYLRYVDMAREKIRNYQESQPKEEKPPRMKGQNIHFPTDRAYPKFWIKHIAISGGEDAAQNPDFFSATGQVLNVSSDQRVTGLPLTIDLTGARGSGVKATFGALFDRRNVEPLDEYKATITGVPMAGFSLGSPDFLPATITGARFGTELGVTIPGRSFDAKSHLTFRTMTIAYSAPVKNVGERLAREVLSGVSGFDVDLRLWNSPEGFKMALATDLDEQFSARVKAVLGAELAKLQNELRAKVNAIIAQKRAEFERLYSAKKAEAEQKLAQYTAIVNEKVAMVDAKKKELEDQLEKAKKGKVEDAVRKLFKKP
jgi:uncharacterized protein (TIGR03545 family)